MKIILSLFILVSAPAFATEKVCDGAKNDSTINGDSLNVNILEDKIIIAPSGKDSRQSAGTYDREKGPNLKGKDGKVYNRYAWGGDEGCVEILVNQDLTHTGTEGWLKFRCRGEGFSDSKYWCHDAN